MCSIQGAHIQHTSLVIRPISSPCPSVRFHLHPYRDPEIVDFSLSGVGLALSEWD